MTKVLNEREGETPSRQHVVAYLLHIATVRRYSPNTVAGYKLDLNFLLKEVEQNGKPLTDTTPAEVREAIIKLRRNKLSPATVARYLASWRGFYSYAVLKLGYPDNPCIRQKGPRVVRPLPKLLFVDNCTQLLDGIPVEQTDQDALLARDRAMFELLYSSGLRVSELTGLDENDIDLCARDARVKGKGNKTRIVPVGKQACTAIKTWLNWRQTLIRVDDTAALFLGRHGSRLSVRSVQLRLDQWVKRTALGQPVNPHMLRHAFASHMLQSSGDLRAVQELLGHANVTTTQIYTFLDWPRLAKVYNTAHPRAKRMNDEKGALP